MEEGKRGEEREMGKHTREELRQWQALPLSVKIRMTEQRIRDWVHEYGESGVYVSFSGGKDSTVLLDIVRNRMGYTDIPAVFVDTGLEYPELKTFVKGVDNVITLRPKMSFKQVVQTYGYPIISKEVASALDGSRKYIEKLTKNRTEQNRTEQMVSCGIWGLADLLGIPRRLGAKNDIAYQELLKGNIPKELSKSLPIRLQMLLGTFEHKENGVSTGEASRMYNKKKWLFMLDAPFKVSDLCCKMMKKSSAHKYIRESGRHPMTGQMAAESRLRTQQWIENGCNGFNLKEPTSNPMAFWTEQDVLAYIKKFNIPIAEPYGEVVSKDGQVSLADFLDDYQESEYTTTKAQRTGCIFCMFGINQDKERFVRLKNEEPGLYDYVMRGGEFADGYWQPNNEGLGYWFVIKWLNEKGGLNIAAPDLESYEEKYHNEETDKWVQN